MMVVAIENVHTILWYDALKASFVREEDQQKSLTNIETQTRGQTNKNTQRQITTNDNSHRKTKEKPHELYHKHKAIIGAREGKQLLF